MGRPAHGTVRARGIDVMLDGLRPVLVADLRVEVIGAAAGSGYEVGPVLAVIPPDGADAAVGPDWTCPGGTCAMAVDSGSEMYPLEYRYALDPIAEVPGLRRPFVLRFEIRERGAHGRFRVVDASDPVALDADCARLARVPLQIRPLAGEPAGPEGEIAAGVIRATGGCEGPVLYVEVRYRVLPVPATRAVLKLGLSVPGGGEPLCAGANCTAELQPPSEGTVVLEKPLGLAFAAFDRPAARAEIRLTLERRPEHESGGVPPESGTVLHELAFELVSPGAGEVQ